MATITYNHKTRSWRLLYKDPAKLSTHRWPYTRKCVKDPLYPLLTGAEKTKRRQEMLLLALNLSCSEPATKTEAPLQAEAYLTQLKKVCRSQHASTMLNSRTAVRKFRDFLAAAYSGIYMHEITTEVVEAFFRSLSHLAGSTLNKYRLTLSYIMRRLICERSESGSRLPYRNPFRTLDLREIKFSEAAPVKRSFTLPQIRQLLRADARYPEQEYVWYFLYMTGWRLSDVLNLRWEQIDMKNRTMQVKHIKTSRYGTTTVLWLTDAMLKTLRALRMRAANGAEFVFPQWADTLRAVDGRNVREQRFIRAVNRRLEAMGWGGGVRQNIRFCRYYSAHCMRSTVITLLKEKNFNTERIMYLCGHRGGSLEARSYNRFYEHPKEATADMLHYLEKLLN